MKIWPRLSTLLLLLLIGPGSIFAQGNFEGRIVYTITYTDLPAEMQGYESMLPRDIKIHLKGPRSRVEQSQMMGTNVAVSDMAKKTGFLEMNVGGQKLRLSVSSEDFKEEAEKMSAIEYVNEGKKIAGYPCQKALMKDENGAVVMTVFYTDKIQNQAQMEFVGLKGFPLEYQMTQQNITMQVTASVVSEEPVPDTIFEKSAGFKDITEAELRQMMGGFIK